MDVIYALVSMSEYKKKGYDGSAVVCTLDGKKYATFFSTKELATEFIKEGQMPTDIVPARIIDKKELILCLAALYRQEYEWALTETERKNGIVTGRERSIDEWLNSLRAN